MRCADGDPRTQRTAGMVAKIVLRGLWRDSMVGETPTVIILRGVLMVPICYAPVQGVVLAMGTRFAWFGWISLYFGLLSPLWVTITTLRRSRGRRESCEQGGDDGYAETQGGKMNALGATDRPDRGRLDEQQRRASPACGYAHLLMGGVLIYLSAGESHLRPGLVGGAIGLLISLYGGYLVVTAPGMSVAEWAARRLVGSAPQVGRALGFGRRPARSRGP